MIRRPPRSKRTDTPFPSPTLFRSYPAAGRGVAYYAVPDAAADQACARRIIFGTLDARLFALDAATGRPCQDFGTNGQVDTKIGMGRTPPGYVSINSPPTIVRGIVVTGHQVLDGQSRWAPSGVIRGYDAITGQRAWAWDQVNPDRKGTRSEEHTSEIQSLMRNS